jgi:hypothetical protein
MEPFTFQVETYEAMMEVVIGELDGFAGILTTFQNLALSCDASVQFIT